MKLSTIKITAKIGIPATTSVPAIHSNKSLADPNIKVSIGGYYQNRITAIATKMVSQIAARVRPIPRLPAPAFGLPIQKLSRIVFGLRLPDLFPVGLCKIDQPLRRAQ